MERSDPKHLAAFSSLGDLLRWVVYGNIYVSLGVVALSYVTQVSYTQNTAFSPLYPFIFFATLLSYSFDRVIDVGSDLRVSSPRILWLASHKRTLLFFSIISVIAILLLVWFLPLRVILILIPMGGVTLLYSIAIPGVGAPLKAFYGLKTILISMIWASATALLPILGSAGKYVSIIPFVVIERFFFIFALTLPFEIRDEERDQLASVQSIVHILGRRLTLFLSISIALALTIVAYFFPLDTRAHAEIWSLTYLFTTLLIIIGAGRERSDWYFSFLLDGMTFAPLVIYFLLVR